MGQGIKAYMTSGEMCSPNGKELFNIKEMSGRAQTFDRLFKLMIEFLDENKVGVMCQYS